MGKNFAPFFIFLLDIYRDPPPQFAFKYQSWYLTPCYGPEVHYPTEALKSVKVPGNTFNLAKSGQERCRPYKTYIITNVYCPNDSGVRKTFIRDITEKMHILTGDFNCVLDKEIDRYPSRNYDDTGAKELKTI